MRAEVLALQTVLLGPSKNVNVPVAHVDSLRLEQKSGVRAKAQRNSFD